MTGTQTVLLPTGAAAAAAMQPAERPQSLKGLRIGLLDNGKEFSDVVLEALAQALRRDHGVTSIKFWRKGFPAKSCIRMRKVLQICACIQCSWRSSSSAVR